MSKLEVVFGWMCPKCKDHGITFDEKLWVYCHYCGSKLIVEETPGDPQPFMGPLEIEG